MSATTQKAKVLFAYAAQAANQISLAPGQVITITSHGGPGGWSSGEEIGTGTLTLPLFLVHGYSFVIFLFHFLCCFRKAWLFSFGLR
jgi:hypothetical protein